MQYHNPQEHTSSAEAIMDKVKPQEAEMERPSSQRSTMQNLSVEEIPNSGHEEDILGSVSSIQEQAANSINNSPNEKKAASDDISIPQQLSNFASKAVEKAGEVMNTVQGFGSRAVDFIGGLIGDIKKEISGLNRDHRINTKPYLLRKSLRRKLRRGQRRGEIFNKYIHEYKGYSRVFIKEEAKYLKRRARTFRGDWRKSSKMMKKQNTDFNMKVHSYDADAERIQMYLSEKARYLRQGARNILNQISRGEVMMKTKATSNDMTPSKWVANFSANDWNGSYKNMRELSREDKPQKWILSIPASQWAHSSEEGAKERANFIMLKAKAYMNKAAEEVSNSQKAVQKEMKKYYNMASKGTEELEIMVRSKIDQWVHEVTSNI